MTLRASGCEVHAAIGVGALRTQGGGRGWRLGRPVLHAPSALGAGALAADTALGQAEKGGGHVGGLGPDHRRLDCFFAFARALGVACNMVRDEGPRPGVRITSTRFAILSVGPPAGVCDAAAAARFLRRCPRVSIGFGGSTTKVSTSRKIWSRL